MKKEYYFYCEGKEGAFEMVCGGRLEAFSIASAYSSVSSELLKRNLFGLKNITIEVTSGDRDNNEGAENEI